jgi:trans-aconitate methyltransferase
MSWEPTQYLKYSSERLRPALDLLARVSSVSPRTVVDLGCGAVTPFLAALDVHAQHAFIVDYTARIEVGYPPLPDGRVLFPFRRVFVVAVRAMR